MYKIAIIGDRESILGFKTLGLKTFEVDTREEALETFEDIVNKDYGIIYVTELVFEMLGTLIEEYAKKMLPAIIPIPGVTGNTGKGMANVSRSVEQAVGSDILFGNE